MNNYRKAKIPFIAAFAVFTLLIFSLRVGADSSQSAATARHFGAQLLLQMRASDANSNVVLPVTGLYTALTLLRETTRRTKPKKQLIRLLGSSSINTDCSGKFNADSKFGMSHAVWLEPASNTDDEEFKKLKHCKGVQIFNHNENPAVFASQVNDWARNQPKTMGSQSQPPLLPNGFSSSIPAGFLASIIKFDAKWQEGFASTSNDVFSPVKGTNRIIPFLKGKFTTLYLEKDGYEAVWLPYEANTAPEFATLFVLPPVGTPSAQMEINKINQKNGFLESRSWKPARVDLSLPTVNITSLSSTLQKALNAMSGGTELFSNKPNTTEKDKVAFSLFTSLQFSTQATNILSTIMQRVGSDLLSNDTAFGAELGEEMPQITMNLNRPFYFVIVHKKTSSILFMGYIANP